MISLVAVSEIVEKSVISVSYKGPKGLTDALAVKERSDVIINSY